MADKSDFQKLKGTPLTWIECVYGQSGVINFHILPKEYDNSQLIRTILISNSIDFLIVAATACAHKNRFHAEIMRRTTAMVFQFVLVEHIKSLNYYLHTGIEPVL